MVNELGRIQELLSSTKKLGLGPSESDALRASAGEFILEGLYAHKRISRNEELAFVAADRSSREERAHEEREEPRRGGFDPRDPRRGPGGGGRRNLN
jgi:magnesium chelatase subunit I